MSRRDQERLADILAAIDAIHAHLQHDDLGSGLVFDAVRVRLIEIGEAVKGIDAEALALRDPVVRRRTDAGSPRPPLLRHDALDRPRYRR